MMMRLDHITIQNKISRTEQIQHLVSWGKWYSDFYLQRLLNTERDLVGKFGSTGNLREVFHGRAADGRIGFKKTHQSMVYQSLLSLELQDPRERFRTKLARWLLQDTTRHRYVAESVRQNTPAGQAQRAHWLLHRLSSLVPPRVSAAVFSTIWNRWITTRRFQQKVIACRFGCGFDQSDSIEHYCRCTVVQQCCRRFLN